MKLAIFALVVGTILVNSAQAQDKAYSRTAAEKSFFALANARDGDIVRLMEQDGLVCFADSLPFNDEDRFLTIILSNSAVWFNEAEKSFDKTSDVDYSARSLGMLDFRAWVNQDSEIVVNSMLGGFWHSYGHYISLKDGKRQWRAADDHPTIFRFEKQKDDITGATEVAAFQDDTVFNASKKFPNKRKGTTEYEMNVRLSTGRYKETWRPDNGDEMTSVGNCYKAKDFIRRGIIPTATK